jgi:3-deoxy-manno-octulosonate cytidylyltransferase (CMP-KDO synthetase)
MADQRTDSAAPCIIIPARFASSRYPGKPLVRLTGARGVARSLIEWSWRAACAVPGAGRVVVATDDRRIADEVARFGGEAIMTPPECANGTERCAAAIAAMDDAPAIIVNFQGDAPLTPPGIVAALVKRMQDEPSIQVATPALACSEATYRHLVDDRAAGRVGGTTMVFDRHEQAHYFSKTIIPFVPVDHPAPASAVFLHLGIYGYRRDALAAYLATPPSPLELLEGLEQLRFLDMRVAVGVVVCEPPQGSVIELNNPTDVAPIELELQRRGDQEAA